MKDPYEVLGVPRGADREQVKAAYRELARKFHPDNYVGSPLAELATEKMQEINEAYDAILSGKAAGGSYNYSNIEALIANNRLEEAESLLESINEGSRNAHWYYLKGQVNYSRGWTQQAFSYFSMAYQMEPNNPQYAAAYQSMQGGRTGGFRTTNRHTSVGGSDCDGCDICTGLLCADCCCECFGGDMIPCC